MVTKETILVFCLLPSMVCYGIEVREIINTMFENGLPCLAVVHPLLSPFPNCMILPLF